MGIQEELQKEVVKDNEGSAFGAEGCMWLYSSLRCSQSTLFFLCAGYFCVFCRGVVYFFLSKIKTDLSMILHRVYWSLHYHILCSLPIPSWGSEEQNPDGCYNPTWPRHASPPCCSRVPLRGFGIPLFLAAVTGGAIG